MSNQPSYHSNALLAKIRRRQLETAQAGRVRESIYYAKLASRVSRVLQNWAMEDGNSSAAVA